MENKSLIHPTTIIDKTATIGEGTRIWCFCQIMSDVTIGKNCNIGNNCFLESRVKIGNRVTIKNNVALYSGVICEDDVFLGPDCVFTNVLNPRSFISRKDSFLPTIVKKGATIGANATIICGNTIGEYALVGAGSVVTKDVLPHELVYGNPARTHGYVCECGEVLNSDLECPRCGTKYSFSKGRIIKI
ncbi:MAG: acyltransferase [Bacilli bacterium]